MLGYPILASQPTGGTFDRIYKHRARRKLPWKPVTDPINNLSDLFTIQKSERTYRLVTLKKSTEAPEGYEVARGSLSEIIKDIATLARAFKALKTKTTPPMHPTTLSICTDIYQASVDSTYSARGDMKHPIVSKGTFTKKRRRRVAQTSTRSRLSDDEVGRSVRRREASSLESVAPSHITKAKALPSMTRTPLPESKKDLSGMPPALLEDQEDKKEASFDPLFRLLESEMRTAVLIYQNLFGVRTYKI